MCHIAGAVANGDLHPGGSFRRRCSGLDRVPVRGDGQIGETVTRYFTEQYSVSLEGDKSKIISFPLNLSEKRDRAETTAPPIKQDNAPRLNVENAEDYSRPATLRRYPADDEVSSRYNQYRPESSVDK